MPMAPCNIWVEIRFHLLWMMIGEKTWNSPYYWDWRDMLEGKSIEEIEAEHLEDTLKNG